jgi:four helix bundle protein
MDTGFDTRFDNRFHAYGAALGVVRGLRPVVEALRKQDRDLADQLRRAASSVVLNLAEGAGRRGQDRMQHYRIAQGSALEVKAALEVARTWGFLEQSEDVDAWLDRLLAMLWRLTHGSARGPGR